ncbi:MAG: hypothetical protein QOI38_1907 [Sphingomonadales bacterium]|jgi:hypothetical protein|nr:hypothetical protein [Sphingomonadales bacterium]
MIATAAALLLAAAAQEPPRIARGLQCEMRTPAGDDLRFNLIPSQGWDNPLELRARDVEGWSTEGARATQVRDLGREAEYRVDGLSRPLLLRVEKEPPAKNATFFAVDGSDAGVPLAFGFCVTYQLDPVTEPLRVAGDPFDPARWDGDCHFVAAAPGIVRTRFGQSFVIDAARRPAMRITPRDAAVWNAPVTAVLESLPGGQSAGVMIDPQRFEGPEGSHLLGQFAAFIDTRTVQASAIIRFNQFTDTNQPGYAICRINAARVPEAPAR